jgi:hypothetical protein
MRPQRLDLGVGRIHREQVRADHARSPGAQAGSFSVATTAAAVRRAAEPAVQPRAQGDQNLAEVVRYLRAVGQLRVVEDHHRPTVRH